MSDAAQPSDSTPPTTAPRRRERVGLHIFLLGLTMVTTTLAGAGLADGPAAAGWIGQVLAGLPYSLMVLSILGAHEMGHYLTCRHYGVDASPPFFLPGPPILVGTFGAFIRLREPMKNRKVLFDVGVAGPLAGFVVMLPILAWSAATAEIGRLDAPGYLEFGEPLLMQLMMWLFGRQVSDGETLLLNPAMMAAWVGCLATALNLIPVGQLDGGHLAYAVSSRFHRVVAPAALVLFCLAGVFIFPGYLIFGMVLVFTGTRHPPVVNESGGIGPARVVIAWIALIILLLCFVPGPVRVGTLTAV